jgi:radical SAM-linked protein
MVSLDTVDPGNEKQIGPMRIRVVFAKTEPMRFTSHLDLYRAWERLLRRAGVELVFSQGYNPRPKLQLAAPLPLGITSQCEIIDFWLSAPPDNLQQLTSTLVSDQPPGIEIKSLEAVDTSAPTLQKEVSSAEYQVALLDQVSKIDQKIELLLGTEDLMRVKRGKSYNLRPLIQELRVDNTAPEDIFMQLDAREGSTGRPEEVLRALEIQPEDTRIERTRIVIRD